MEPKKNKAAQNLGKMGRGKPKTMSPAAIEARRSAAAKSLAARAKRKAAKEENGQ